MCRHHHQQLHLQPSDAGHADGFGDHRHHDHLHGFCGLSYGWDDDVDDPGHRRDAVRHRRPWRCQHRDLHRDDNQQPHWLPDGGSYRRHRLAVPNPRPRNHPDLRRHTERQQSGGERWARRAKRHPVQQLRGGGWHAHVHRHCPIFARHRSADHDQPVRRVRQYGRHDRDLYRHYHQ